MDSIQEHTMMRSAQHGSALPVLRVVTARELREHLRSARFVMILATTLVLVVLSTLAGVFNYRVQVEQYQIGVARGEQKLKEATTWSELQPIVVRPVTPLMILNAGFEARDGRIAVVSNSQIPATTQDSPVGTPYLARFGEFDVTTVSIYLLGLLAILLSFDAVSGEKERGTLALILSNALGRWQILLGKYLGGMIALTLALLMSLAAAMIVWLVSGVQVAGATWLRIGLWFISILLYLSAMFSIGLLISVFTRRAAVSLLIGMVAWFFLVIFIPVVASFAASQLARLPSVYTLEREEQRLSDELEQKSAEVKNALGKPPESDGVSISLQQGISLNFYSPEAYQWWLKYYSERARLERDYALKVYQKFKEYLDQNRAQATLAFKLSSLSPVAHLERVTNELTGTSKDDINRFMTAAEQYRQSLIDYYDAHHLTTSLRWITDDPPGSASPFPKGLTDKANDAEEMQKMKELGKELYAQVLAERASGKRALPISDLPQFVYKPQSVNQAFGQVSTSISALVFISLLCLVFAFLRFKHYGVR
jgi:ABC-type transport system involved in multi-copper enzyme maturation permease subunit